MLVMGLLALTFFSSCAKQGEVGPTGPAGKDGINGTNGLNGTNGTDGQDGQDGTNGTNGTNGTDGVDGKDGNANVIGTNPFSVTSTNWISGGGGTYYTATFTSSVITQAIVDKGVVMCYMQISNGVWTPLPVGIFSFYFTTGTLVVFSDDSANPGARTFRMVAISASNLEKYPDLDLNNYEEVTKTLNISNN